MKIMVSAAVKRWLWLAAYQNSGAAVSAQGPSIFSTISETHYLSCLIVGKVT